MNNHTVPGDPGQEPTRCGACCEECTWPSASATDAAGAARRRWASGWSPGWRRPSRWARRSSWRANRRRDTLLELEPVRSLVDCRKVPMQPGLDVASAAVDFDAAAGVVGTVAAGVAAEVLERGHNSAQRVAVAG